MKRTTVFGEVGKLFTGVGSEMLRQTTGVNIRRRDNDYSREHKKTWDRAERETKRYMDKIYREENRERRRRFKITGNTN